MPMHEIGIGVSEESTTCKGHNRIRRGYYQSFNLQAISP